MQSIAEKIEWLNGSHFDRTDLTETQWHWLSSRGSLTQKIREYTQGKIALILNFQTWQLPNDDEIEFLNMPLDEIALVREINWIYKDQVWVKGRVIIPKSSTVGQGKSLMTIDERSLGEILFTDPNLKRDEFYYHQYNQTATRRSIFHFHKKPILVQEQFLFDLFP